MPCVSSRLCTRGTVRVGKFSSISMTAAVAGTSREHGQRLPFDEIGDQTHEGAGFQQREADDQRRLADGEELARVRREGRGVDSGHAAAPLRGNPSARGNAPNSIFDEEARHDERQRAVEAQNYDSQDRYGMAPWARFVADSPVQVRDEGHDRREPHDAEQERGGDDLHQKRTCLVRRTSSFMSSAIGRARFGNDVAAIGIARW